MQNQLQQIRRAHTHMVKAYEGKLAEFVIPVEELGFDPLVPTNIDWLLFHIYSQTKYIKIDQIL